MRRTMRQKRRWFHAVAITCLSGFALCGCARGTRDLSSNLQKNAEKEAIEAERSIAERKRQDSKVLDDEDFEEKTAAVSRSENRSVVSKRSDDPWSEAEDRKRALPDERSDTDAGERENRIQVVSGSESEDNRWADPEPVEELFTESAETEDPIVESEVADSVADMPTASANEAEGTVRIRKEPAPTPPGTRSRSEYTQSTARSGQASYRGTQEHPWSRKAPVANHSAIDEQGESTPAENRTDVVESRMEETDAQLETKARVRVLVEQAKSLLRKGEYRSAYRAAQVAQRMAESGDVFFAAGEEQPAEVVRAVLNKIRAEETRLAATSQNEARQPELSQQGSKSEAAETPKKTTVSKLPDDWTFAEWQPGDKPLTSKTARDTSTGKSEGVAGMRIQPGHRSRSDAKAFPGRTDWKSAGQITSDENIVEQSSASTADDASSKVVPATLPADSLVRSADLKAPRPFPDRDFDRSEKAPAPPEVSSELSVSQSWRNENLESAGTGRMPLLVAPLPPQEPIAAPLVETTDETLAVEADNTSQPASDSKLWLLLAAAAGAFAMLFVRRRPARD